MDLNAVLKRLADKGLIEINESGSQVRLTQEGHAKVERDLYGELLEDEIEPEEPA